jgi:hypothetical protein
VAGGHPSNRVETGIRGQIRVIVVGEDPAVLRTAFEVFGQLVMLEALELALDLVLVRRIPRLRGPTMIRLAGNDTMTLKIGNRVVAAVAGQPACRGRGQAPVDRIDSLRPAVYPRPDDYGSRSSARRLGRRFRARSWLRALVGISFLLVTRKTAHTSESANRVWMKPALPRYACDWRATSRRPHRPRSPCILVAVFGFGPALDWLRRRSPGLR